MSKIHEVLAAEPDVVSQAKAITQETITTFTRKDSHFKGFVKELNMFSDERQVENTSEVSLVQTTVDAKLDHTWDAVGSAIDTVLTKEMSNVSPDARADVVVNGVVIVAGLGVGALLALSKRLTAIEAVYSNMPTLDPALSWVEDPNGGDGMFKSTTELSTMRTEKTVEPVIVAPATKEHKAQVQVINKDVPIGKYTVRHQSGAKTVSAKAKTLKNIYSLKTAVKEAIQRANQADAVQMNVATSIRDFIES